MQVIPVRWGVLLLLAWWFLLGGSVVRAGQWVEIADVHTEWPLGATVEFLDDPEQEWNAEQAWQQATWQPATPEVLSPGVTASAIWLRLHVRNATPFSQERWLVLGSARLEDVRYYRFTPEGQQSEETVYSGLAYPLRDRQVRSVWSVFPLNVVAHEQTTILLRISSRTRIILNPSLWHPWAYRAHESDMLIKQMMPISVILVLALYVFIHGGVRRSRDMLWLGLWLLVLVCYECSFRGYLYHFVWSEGGEWPVRATLVLSFASALLCAVFSFSFLRLQGHSTWRWVYGILILIHGLLFQVALWGDLRWANHASIPALLAFYVLLPTSVLNAWRRGIRNAALYFWAIQVVWPPVILRLLEQQGGLISQKISFDTLTLLSSLGLVLVIVYGVVRDSHAEQQAHQLAQTRLREAKQDVLTRLECVVRDRTQDLQQTLIRADEAHRDRTELLRRVNHDLRQPVADIIEWATVVHQMRGTVAEYGGVIRRSARHLQGLIDDFLVDAVPGRVLAELHLVRCLSEDCLYELVAEARDLVQGRGNHFVFHGSPDLPRYVYLDPKRLRQIVINLLDNAAKFTYEGQVELRVEVLALGTVGRLGLSVCDTGMGMTAEQLEQVFEPYQRAKQARHLPGVGLGLAIARYWVERMGGEIVARSQLGEGTCMQVVLPVRWEDGVEPIPLVRPENLVLNVPRWPEDMVRPSAHDLQVALAWVKLGAVSDLLDWAAELVAQQPTCAAFAQWVAECAAKGELRVLSVALSENVTTGPLSAADADKPASTNWAG